MHLLPSVSQAETQRAADETVPGGLGVLLAVSVDRHGVIFAASSMETLTRPGRGGGLPGKQSERGGCDGRTNEGVKVCSSKDQRRLTLRLRFSFYKLPGD